MTAITAIAPNRGPVSAALDSTRAARTRAFEARAQTVGASEVGRCARAVFFEKNEGGDFGAVRDSGYTDSWGARVRGYASNWRSGCRRCTRNSASVCCSRAPRRSPL